jgi:hypothetical protein
MEPPSIRFRVSVGIAPRIPKDLPVIRIQAAAHGLPTILRAAKSYSLGSPQVGGR